MGRVNCLKAAEPVRRLFTFNHKREDCLLLTTSTQESLLLISSTPEGWNAQSTFKPPVGIEPGTPGLGIQSPNY